MKWIWRVIKGIVPQIIESLKERSLKKMGFVQWLDVLFFVVGIAFLLWMIVDLSLRYLVPGSALVLSAIAVPVTSFIGPVAIGYWAGWLSLRLLFRPLVGNVLWQGVIPSHREELVGAVARVISKSILSDDKLIGNLRRGELLSGLARRVTEATNRQIGDEVFREDLRNLLRQWIVATLENNETREAIKDAVGRIIEAWHARHFIDKPMELSKKVWGPWVQEKVLEAIPVIPEAMIGVIEQMDPWLDQLGKTIQDRGEHVERAVSEVLMEGLHFVDFESIVRQQMDSVESLSLEKGIRATVERELNVIKAGAGFVGLLLGLAMRLAIIRIGLLFLVLIGWLVYRISINNERSNDSGRKDTA